MKSPPTASSIGGHIRHSLDHFQSLFTGIKENSTIEYDSRERGTDIELMPSAAESAIRELQESIDQLTEEDLKKSIKYFFFSVLKAF